PGLADTPELATAIYAEATSDFTGGFEGVRPVVAEADEAAALERLEESLATQVEPSVAPEIPAGFVSVAVIGDPEFQALSPEARGEDLAIRAEMAVQVAIISEVELARFALTAAGSGTDADGDNMLITNPEVLSEAVELVDEET